MPLLEEVKRAIERVTGFGRPGRAVTPVLLRKRQAHAFHFRDDGRTPNNPRLPLILYRSPVLLSQVHDPASIFEELFAQNDWKNSWRNGIYGFLHFHAGTHEVLGVAVGHGRIEFGGSCGRELRVKAGDVVVLPAGTGHRCLSASQDLLVVGAYAAGGNYDELKPGELDHRDAVASIARVPLPSRDPVYGGEGSLLTLWNVKVTG
jgi:uncharacterized protein YjlB